MKLLIVEDNYMDREGLKAFVNWEEFGIGSIETAKNGQQGYEKAIEFHPDIILSDISMPVMDGLTMAEKLREILPDVKFLFISAFDEKKYIMDAVNLNAYGYILKPIQMDKLTLALEKTLEITVNEKERNERLTFLEQEINEYIPLIQESFLRDLFFGSIKMNGDNATQASKMLMDLRRYYTVISISFEEYNISDKENSMDRNYLLIYKVKEAMEYLAYFEHRKIRLFSMIQNYRTLTALIYFDDAETKELAQDDVILYLEKCKGKISNELGGKAIVSIGKISDDFHEVAEIFKNVEESLEFERYGKNNSIILADEIKNTGMPDIYNIQDLKAELSGIVETGSMEDAANFVQKYFNGRCDKHQNVFKQLLFLMVSILQMILYEHNENFGTIFNDELVIWKKILYPQDILDMRQWFVNLLKAAIERIGSKENAFYIKFVEDIKAMIDSEYADIDNISVITERLYVSKNHANVIFKRYAGETIFDYLIQTRIRHAKQMLMDSNAKIYEIAGKIGYKSNAYFTSAFKEHTGFTPKEYRNSYAKRPKGTGDV